MRLSSSWLREWVDPSTDTAQLAEQLTLAGLEAERVVSTAEEILVLSLTPDRGDCLSVAGLAREVSALHRLSCHGPDIPEVAADIDEQYVVRVARPGDCPRYVGRVLTGVDATAPTPPWMTERLLHSGQRGVNAIVDITNYVMLELGQPMHAFDLDRLQGPLVVRRARRGESLQLLNGTTFAPAADCLLIADSAGPLALAGIMGGERAGVSPQTRAVFLESALFMPGSVQGRAWRYGLHTESSMRFERGVDPALQRLAMERASALILQCCGGRPGPVLEHSNAEGLPRRRPIRLRHRWLQGLLGFDIPAEQVQDCLQRLGLAVESVAGGWRCVPPGYRYDLALDVDLAAEVVRLIGYHALPATVPTLPLHMDMIAAPSTRSDALQWHLVEQGYHEVVTYSFVDPEWAGFFGNEALLGLSNPLSEQAAVMRRGLWPGLLQVLQYNQHRQQTRIRLYEYGKIYAPDGEEYCLGGVVAGPQWEEQWAASARPADLYDVKQDLQPWVPAGARWQAAEIAGLHPGYTAELRWQDRLLGRVGQLHPTLVQRLNLPAPPWLFELYPGRFPQPPRVRHRPASRFPSSRRDLALVVEESLPAQHLIDAICEKYGDLIEKAVIFDVFQGGNLPATCKSLAIGLIFQKKSVTLTDKDVDSAVTQIQQMLKERFDAELRAR